MKKSENIIFIKVLADLTHTYTVHVFEKCTGEPNGNRLKWKSYINSPLKKRFVCKSLVGWGEGDDGKCIGDDLFMIHRCILSTPYLFIGEEFLFWHIL